MKYVLCIATNTHVIGPKHRKTGFFFPEIAHPWHEFESADIALEYTTLLGGQPTEDGYDEKDPVQKAFKESLAYRRLGKSRKLSEVDVLDYDAIFFPGGLGPMADLADSPEIKAAVMRAYNAGKLVSAVCHGPVALLGAKLDDGTPLLKGRHITAFANSEEEGYAQDDVPFMLETALRADGALFEQVAPWQPKVVVDGRIITGQNPASAGPMAKAVIAAFAAAAK